MAYRYLLATIILVASPALAEPVGSLNEAISRSVVQNPDVLASWYTFEAAAEEQRAGEGGYYPKVDLTGQIGHEKLDRSNQPEIDYEPWNVRLTLTQMLFDGFATRNEVSRLDHLRKVRFYEFRSTSEAVALETVRAYMDTMRYQQLVALAKDNYIQHRSIFADIEERHEAGIARRVDLEQATARLALAEANLLTEATNLHDVTARFQRVVGELPAARLDVPELPDLLIPNTRGDTLERAYVLSPRLNAAIENVLAAHAARKARDAAMMPRLDLRLRGEVEDFTDGVDERREEQAIELLMSYNLYNGGSDAARQRQFDKLVDVAFQLREKACRDVRQDTVIAFNDIGSLRQQEQYIARNQAAVADARVAYREQFDIGQRTLLDLLDTENEYFEVRRTYVNTVHNLKLAQARTLATMGQLLASYDVAGIDGAKAAQDAIEPRNDLEGRCPPELPVQTTFDKEAIMAGLLTDSRFREIDGDKLAFRMDAKFAFDSAVLVNSYDKDISDAATFLKDNPEVVGVIAGHTDYIGTEQYNMGLSQRRAQAVYDRLTNTHGIDPARLEVVGYGEIQPMADNKTAEGRRLNRRVDMVIDKSEKFQL